MNTDSNETEPDRRALAISVWENEGGARAPDTPDGQFGRRVEMDRSWTIYHVFPGIPARVDGSALTDLSRSAATDGMLSLFATSTVEKTGTPGRDWPRTLETRVPIMTVARRSIPACRKPAPPFSAPRNELRALGEHNGQRSA
jgi:hypothetical protein